VSTPIVTPLAGEAARATAWMPVSLVVGSASSLSVGGVAPFNYAGTGVGPTTSVLPFGSRLARTIAAHFGGRDYEGRRAPQCTFVAAVPVAPTGLRNPRLAQIIASRQADEPFSGRRVHSRAADGPPYAPGPLPSFPGRLGRLQRAFQAEENYPGAQSLRRGGAIALPPLPPISLGKASLLTRIASHFFELPFAGRRLPRRDFSYLGGSDLPARASQIVAETLYQASPAARASQLILEALSGIHAQFRASQLVLENLVGNSPQVRVSQIVIEVLVPTPELAVIPIYPALGGLTYSVIKRPKFSTGAGVAGSGKEVRVGYWANPQWEWDLTYEVLNDNGVPNGTTESDIKTLVGFFLLASASLWPFYFLDPDDYQVTGQALGTGDGVTKNFLMVRTYGLNSFVGTEPVGSVNAGETVNFYLDDVLQDSGCTLNNTTPCGNYVQFAVPPAPGVEITSDFQFWYYARFKDDSYDFEKIMDSLWNQKKITIFSLKS
jgi:uncharacterized protein (TIGR02217 family)